MEIITVQTQEELKSAQKRDIAEIIIEGKLAVKIRIMKRLVIAFKCTIVVLIVIIGLGIITAPYTMGMLLIPTLLLVTLIIILLNIAVAVIATTLGLGLITIITKEYKILQYEREVIPKMRLSRKKDNKL